MGGDPLEHGGGGLFKARDVAVLLVFICRLVQTVLRMAMGAVMVYVCEDLECGPASQGWLLSAYAIGYCTTQILGGRIADRAGGKDVVTMSLAMAGLSLAVTPLVATQFGLTGVAAGQVALGVATGPLFPATMQFLGRWLPPSERPRASTALNTGITVGSLIAVPLSGLMAVRIGWRFVMGAYGVFSLAFSLVWALAAELPEHCGYCSDAERAFLAKALPPRPSPAGDGKAAAGGFGEALVHVKLWAIYLAHFAFNYGVYFVNSWSATYYMDAFGLRPEQAGLHLTLPHSVNLLVNLFAIPFITGMLRVAGVSNLACRRTYTGLGFLVSAACMLAVPHLSHSLNATTACFTLSLAFAALHPAGFKANYMDVTTEHSGLVSGIGNTIASVAPSIGPLLVVRMRMQNEGRWDSSFASVALLNLVAALVFCAFSSTVPIEEDMELRAGRKRVKAE